MRGIRAIKNQMRRDLHAELQVPAYYRASSAGDWVEVDVRIHTKFTQNGDLPEQYVAQMQDISPRIIFMRDQVELPARGGIVSVEPGEAYQIGDAMEPDGLTITAMVAPMSAAQTVGLPIRECYGC